MRRNPTNAERVLWQLLRNKRLAGTKWKYQQQIGRYIPDFVCFAARLIVEANGSQHLDNGYDAERDRWLVSQNFRILRFWNTDILSHPEGVLTVILAALDSPGASIEPAPMLSPLPGPPPQGGREQKEQPSA